MLFSRSKGLVGLDSGSSAMKLVELKERKGEYSLQRLGIEPLSPEAIVDGSIMDSSLVVDAIHKLNDATGATLPSYATSLSGHSVIIKKIQMPAMPAEARMLAPNCRTESKTISIDARVKMPMVVTATFFSTRTWV